MKHEKQMLSSFKISNKYLRTVEPPPAVMESYRMKPM